MKWKKPKVGDHRIKEGFLWFPKTIQDETRWLEYAVWEQIYCSNNARLWRDECFFWKNTQWLSEKPDK